MRLRFKIIVGAGIVAAAAAVAFLSPIESAYAGPEAVPEPRLDAKTKECVDCHLEKRVAVDWIRQWSLSAHGAKGVGCPACHTARAEDVDAWEHEGFTLTHVPSPRDCGKCHKKEAAEFEASHHAKAAQFIGSLDNFLGEVVEGGPAANLGCKQCHGSQVELDVAGVPVAGTWPNTGIGRVNPDGSWGTCTACHTKHMFRKIQAREPATCGRCHMGPDHPQLEIFEESKHGINFAAYREEMALEADAWIVGETYSAAPTCATCHMSATPAMNVTHDVGARIAWTLRPVVSKQLENGEAKRGRMKAVCLECHGPTWVDNYFLMYDDAVALYNDKFGGPASAVMEDLRAAGAITATPFDDPIEWTFFELWHHEGRRARMGASMMGPDFTQWHGFYEVANHFYNEFVPEAEALRPGVTAEALAMPEHGWRGGLSAEEIEEMLNYYRSRYGD